MKEIPLTRGMTAIVDDEDFDMVSKYKWHVCTGDHRDKTYYAATNIYFDSGKRYVRMHRMIIGATPDVEVDHKNNNGLDNTRKNLRLATDTEQCCNKNTYKNNTTGHKGVSVRSNGVGYQAQIQLNKKLHYLGRFDTPEEAYAVYCKAAKEMHGEFANTGEQA